MDYIHFPFNKLLLIINFMKADMIKAVIFDMDGILINSEPFWQASEYKVFGSLGLDVNKNLFEQFMGKRIDEVVACMYKVTPWDKVSQEQVVEDIMDSVIQFVKEDGKALPGVRETLKTLQESSLKIALASSSKMKIINAVLDKLELREYFEIVHSAEYEEYGKPHPQIFISTANMLQVDPSECLVIEDSINGVISALGACMKCIAVPEKEATNLNKFIIANKVLESLEDFNLEEIKLLQ